MEHSPNHEKAEIIEKLKEELSWDKVPDFISQMSGDQVHGVLDIVESQQERVAELQKPIYRMMAATCKLLPNMMIAKMAQDYLTPFIIAQVTPYMEPKESGNIGKSLKPEFMGRVTIYVDPELTAKIASYMGMPWIHNIFIEMYNLGYFVRLGEVSDFLTDKDLKAVIAKIKEPEKLFKIVQHMNNDDKIRYVGTLLDPYLKSNVIELLKEVNSENISLLE